jgi:hypothetical protein
MEQKYQGVPEASLLAVHIQHAKDISQQVSHKEMETIRPVTGQFSPQKS